MEERPGTANAQRGYWPAIAAAASAEAPLASTSRRYDPPARLLDAALGHAPRAAATPTPPPIVDAWPSEPVAGPSQPSQHEREISYELVIIQHPQRGRMCGFGA